MSDVTKGFSLAELIEHTANELRQARQSSVRDAVMLFAKYELEIAVTVKAEAGAGFRFWVVDASGKLAGETVSKVKLSFDANPDNPMPMHRPPRTHRRRL